MGEVFCLISFVQYAQKLNKTVHKKSENLKVKLLTRVKLQKLKIVGEKPRQNPDTL